MSGRAPTAEPAHSKPEHCPVRPASARLGFRALAAIVAVARGEEAQPARRRQQGDRGPIAPRVPTSGRRAPVSRQQVNTAWPRPSRRAPPGVCARGPAGARERGAPESPGRARRESRGRRPPCGGCPGSAWRRLGSWLPPNPAGLL